MPQFMAVAGLVGGVMSAYGTYTQGQETKRAQNYNASMNENEAALTRYGAQRENDIIKQNAVLNEYRARKQLTADVGTMGSRYAKAGVTMSGSPLNVIADSISNAELDISINKWNAENQVSVNTYNSEVAARQKESEAKMRRMYGTSAATNATYGAVGTLLSSATQYGSALSKEKTPTKKTIG